MSNLGDILGEFQPTFSEFCSIPLPRFLFPEVETELKPKDREIYSKRGVTPSPLPKAKPTPELTKLRGGDSSRQGAPSLSEWWAMNGYEGG